MKDTTALLPHIRLRFNIEHPNLEECYLFGYECALSEISEEENPFLEDSEEYNQWMEGWWAGFYQEEPLFDLNADSEKEKPAEAKDAANDDSYHHHHHFDSFLLAFIKITGALAATAVVGYQVFDLVA